MRMRRTMNKAKVAVVAIASFAEACILLAASLSTVASMKSRRRISSGFIFGT
ncbi:hypothetical protein D3C87_2056290 [compost metagenome]